MKLCSIEIGWRPIVLGGVGLVGMEEAYWIECVGKREAVVRLRRELTAQDSLLIAYYSLLQHTAYS